MKKLHEQVAKVLRSAKFNAKLYTNLEMPHQPFEVRVKNINSSTANELQQMMCNRYKNDLINIVIG